ADPCSAAVRLATTLLPARAASRPLVLSRSPRSSLAAYRLIRAARRRTGAHAGDLLALVRDEHVERAALAVHEHRAAWAASASRSGRPLSWPTCSQPPSRAP